MVSESSDQKSVSAKTITLRSNGTAKSVEETESEESRSKTPAEVKDSEATSQTKEESKKDQSVVKPVEEPVDEVQAATKIQAAFRGHRTRQSMKQPAAEAANQPEPEPTREQLEQEFRLDDPGPELETSEKLSGEGDNGTIATCDGCDSYKGVIDGDRIFCYNLQRSASFNLLTSYKPKLRFSVIHSNFVLKLFLILYLFPELCHAATKIQASFRGHMTRKHESEAKKQETGSSKEEKKEAGDDGKEEELDIDLTDPDLNKAAVKIQASFRGHMVRKENPDEATAAN
ncbi:hypothetical protein NQ315_006223 [Exocentrus adspersus]|uniref:Uncharacterized protein n=1 Tax=Exocentrus adspersus TaxID=1586481 RepID=A0AAV8W035_9CUCU|nr:hypothetical protein NQ315_006223 [Exocentrus adspersus]